MRLFSIISWLAIALLVAASPLRAAGPATDAPAANDTFLRDFAETRGFMLGRPVGATPTPDGSAVLFLRAHSAREPSQELYEFNVATGQTHRLLSAEGALQGTPEQQLTPEEKARRERQRISVGGFTAFSISPDGALVLLSLSGKLYVLHRAEGKVSDLATEPGTIVDPKFSPDSRSVAYVRDQDVCVFDLATGKEHAVTTGGTETISHGLAEFVAQEEMARFSGYWWSPDSRQILYQENDASKVETWFVCDPAQPGNAPARSFYPRPGKENVSVRLGLVTAAGGNAPTTWLDWDRAHFPYLGKVTWSEHGPLTLTVLSRDQTDLSLLKADPATGQTTSLLTEHDPAWVDLEPDVPRWLSPEGGFLWSAPREGTLQLELHRPDGALERVLTTRNQGFISLAGVAGGQAYVLQNLGIPIISVLGNIPLDGSQPADLYAHLPATDPGGNPLLNGGIATVNFGESETIFCKQSQTPGSMPRWDIGRVGSFSLGAELPSVALDPPFVPKIEFAVVGGGPAPESAPSFYTAIIRPHGFDPAGGHKYPVIVDVYGGPKYQQVLSNMRTYLLDQWMADQGFIVVAIDGRGTPGRGRDWERAIAGHFGSVPLDDQVAALKLLGVKYPELDLDRVGIVGWSFGGYMSALAVLRRPDVFKAAVAGAPVVDWLDYDTCYTERYLGVPGAGRWPEAYQEGSLLTYAAGLSRPLLLIHGTSDDNVYFRHSLRLAQAFFLAGKPFDFLPLSGFTHMVPDPVVRARLQERVVRQFKEHL